MDLAGTAKILVVVLCYALPSLVAWRRRPSHRLLAILVNLGLGWTGIGWMAALILATRYPRCAYPALDDLTDEDTPVRPYAALCEVMLEPPVMAVYVNA